MRFPLSIGREGVALQLRGRRFNSKRPAVFRSYWYDDRMNGAATPPVSITIVVLVTLAAIFAASWAMFWALVRRWTWDREWVALSDWSRDAGFQIRRDPSPGPLPAPLDSIRAHHPSPSVILSDAQLAHPRCDRGAHASRRHGQRRWRRSISAGGNGERGGAVEPGGAAPGIAVAADRVAADGPAHELHRSLPALQLPAPRAGERFTIFGSDSAAAAALSASSARALLPPDVGLLLHGNELVLDFSDRPFDSIEFERMLVIADQIVSHLPSLGSEG